MSTLCGRKLTKPVVVSVYSCGFGPKATRECEQSITSGFALELPSTHALIAYTRGSIRYRPTMRGPLVPLTKSIVLSQSVWQKKRGIDFPERVLRDTLKWRECKVVSGCKGQESLDAIFKCMDGCNFMLRKSFLWS